MIKRDIHKELGKRILLLDGAFGTMVQRYNLSESDFRGDRFGNSECPLLGCNDLLSLTQPHIVEEIHRAYLDAGADIIETNSFNANAISLKDYGLQNYSYEIARTSASLARGVADEYEREGGARYVVGTMGPTSKSASIATDIGNPSFRDVTFEELVVAYREQAQGLIDGGVDIVMIETIFDTLNAKAAIYAVRSIAPDFPLMISVTLSDAAGRTLSGQTIEAFYASISYAKPISVGLNCSFGAEAMYPYLQELSNIASEAISLHPNAGLPNLSGGYDETPEEFVKIIERYLEEERLNIVGGCCGTTPEHISLLRRLLESREFTPRVPKENQHITTLSGLEALKVTPQSNFINIGERTNVAGSAKFARLVRNSEWDEALSIARNQVDAGAQAIDICMDDALIDAPNTMRTFINLINSEPEISRVPIVIDSSSWETIVAGLQSVQGKALVNSISLKEGEEEFLRRASEISRYGAAVVVMLFDEAGQADNFDRKIEIAQRSYDLLINSGFAPEDIVFDPNILAVSTGLAEHDRYALDYVEAVRWIKSNLPYCKCSGGVSNLSFAFRGNNAVREAMHSAFLFHARCAGMDMGIVNPAMLKIYSDIEPELLKRVEDVILFRREDASQRLIDFASTMQRGGEQVAENVLQWRLAPLRERVKYSLIKGITDFIKADILEVYAECGSALSVIDNILMPIMGEIGTLFGEGKMFLPQVVKSARVMKQSVEYLSPYMQGAQSESGSVVLLATVKGDVHDIGKNIAAVVMGCAGHKVHDLGVMVDPMYIVEQAESVGADFVVLSGLISPSLEYMKIVASEMERRAMNIPLIVAGATTSPMHTAVILAPCYSAPVIHAADASCNNQIIAALTSNKAEQYIEELRESQSKLRELYYSSANRGIEPRGYTRIERGIQAPPKIEPSIKVISNYSISELLPFIDWEAFYAGWATPKGADERAELYMDALGVLSKVDSEGLLKLEAVVGEFAAYADGDNILIITPDGERTLPMLRSENSSSRSVADFVDGGAVVRCFALTAGVGLEMVADRDSYEYIMLKLLADRLAEAFAQRLFPRGCRVAFGYPAAPDHSLKRDIFEILSVEKSTSMILTESCMIVPGESICGIHFEQGEFFNVGKIGEEQLADYAARRGMRVDEIKMFIPRSIL